MKTFLTTRIQITVCSSVRSWLVTTVLFSVCREGWITDTHTCTHERTIFYLGQLGRLSVMVAIDETEEPSMVTLMKQLKDSTTGSNPEQSDNEALPLHHNEIFTD